MINKLLHTLKQQRWFQFVHVLVTHFEEDECREKAASLTYTTALSIVPILTVFLIILSGIPALEDAKHSITQWIYGNVLPQTGIKITQYFNDFAQKSSNLTIIGVLILFITTMMMLLKVQNVFNRLWQVPHQEKGLLDLSMTDIARYWMLMTLVPVLLGIAFIMSSTVSSLSLLNKQVAGYAIDWAIWLEILSMLLTLLGLVAVYWLVPACKVPFKHALVAGVFVGVVFELLKSLFGFIMGHFTSYQLVYGAFAALPLLLLWIYLSWCLILLGVEISYTLHKVQWQTNPKTNPHSTFSTQNHEHILANALQVLAKLHQAQHSGSSLSEHDLLTQANVGNMAHWQKIHEVFTTQNIITQDQQGKYLLKTNLTAVSLWQVITLFGYALPDDMITQRTQTNGTQANSTEQWQQLQADFKLSNQQLATTLNKPVTDYL